MASPLAILQEYLTKFAKEWLKKQLDDIVLYESRVHNLETDVPKLEDVRLKVLCTVEEEETRYGREIDSYVHKWLEGVEEIISKYKKFNEDGDHKYAQCSNFLHLNLVTRRSLSITADVIMKQVTELLKHPRIHDISHWGGPPSIDAILLNIDYESFESREKTRKDIMEALKDSSVRMIGVHGLSGVGKTTLVKKVAREARDDKLFNMVIMANVTRNPDMIKIQGQIAEMLGIKLEEESDIGRAARIRKRLKNDKENTLLILDDLWVKLDFNMLGIPTANDEDAGKSPETYSTMKTKNLPNALGEKKEESVPGPFEIKKAGKVSSAYNESKTTETLDSAYKGCKVLLISESKQVLMSQMEGKEKLIFSLDVLKETEAETLFKNMAGIGYNNSEFKKLAPQIAKKCEGLPRSIVTTARALKNQSHSVWQDVQRKLQRQKLTDAPEFTTKLSYDLLENEELKSTFLLCARIGQDALIMDLVKYCIGLGVLEGVYTVSEARDRVNVLVGKLKESSLFYESYSRYRFTMPDIVYRAALSIAAKENHAFTMRMGKLAEWPDKDKLKRYTAISLQHCDMIGEFPETINCPRLRVFHVENSYAHLKIPNNFFKGMKELRVLVLVGILLSPFPFSIRCLTELRMLCLERCILGEELEIIGEMKKLRILSLSGSDIIQLPDELKQLTKLQIFDISNCSKLTKIPSGVISSLISLEELYMRNTPIQWKVEGQTNQSEYASLSELRHLNQLTTLDIQIPDVYNLPNNLFFDKLYNYNIAIGDLNAYLETNFKMPEKYETSRFLAIHLKVGSDIHSQKGIKMLFDRVENLLLEDLDGVHDIFSELNLKGFPYLKHLSIVSNSDIQSLIESEKHTEMAFPKLESLDLYNLKNMKKICSCPLSAPSFGKLKVIKIKLCGKLKNVFLFSVIERFANLETIEVSECDSLEEIVSTHTQNTNENKLKFLQLRSLRLQSLPKFNGFCLCSSAGETKKLFHREVEVPNLERMELSSIEITQIWEDQPSQSFRSLTHLDVNGCGNLTYLLSFSMAKHLMHLQSLFISDCDEMVGIFPRSQGDANMKDVIFPNLRNIKLSKMKILSEIWNSEAPLESFGKLDTLIIEECHKLVHIFPRYMVGIFRSLCKLRVTNCKKVEVIFDLDDKNQDARDVNLQDVHLEALPKLEHVWKWNKDQQGIFNLENLQKILVRYCNSLKNVFPVSVAKFLKNLEYLVLWGCYELREIFAKVENTTNIEFVFPKLTTVKFSILRNLESLYPGAHQVRCPVLSDFSVELCDRLELFEKETANVQKRPIFPKEVISKLKSMQIEWHINSSSSYNYGRDNLEELQLSKLMNTDILYSFLHRTPNLKSLSLNNCFFQELVPIKRPREIEILGVVPKLKSLKLNVLPNLVMIGFERDPVLQRIEIVILKDCPSLLTVVPSSVSVSFSHLTTLEVVDCNGLINLMPLSTAKSMVQLSTMKVIRCESMVEIVSGLRNEQESVGQVVFRQLEALELVSLKNLTSFCSSESCDFEFPSLEKLVVSACPKMENFSYKTSMPILQKIYAVDGKEKRRWYWEGNLKATIQHMSEKKKFFEGMDVLNLCDYPVLLQAWGGADIGLQNGSFYSLETLKLENCGIQPYAIPSNVLPYLKSLKVLEVRHCNFIEGIFFEYKETSFQLKKLTLESLSGLTHVWKSCEGFHNLQQLVVRDCHNLHSLLPEAIAKNLKKLEILFIESCDHLSQIVGKEEKEAIAEVTEEEAIAEVTEEEAIAEMTEFVFPCLTSLNLYWLPKLSYFYPERFTLVCPELNCLTVWNNASSSNNGQPLFSDLKTYLVLGEVPIPDRCFSNLKSLIVKGCHFLSNAVLPSHILPFLRNLERLMVHKCNSVEAVFDKPLHHTKIGPASALHLNLKILNLNELPNLKHVWNEDPQGIISLPFLEEVWVDGCDSLTSLFPAPVAKGMLKTLNVRKCKGLVEIVAKNEERATEGAIEELIIFSNLSSLRLGQLPNLTCFYPGMHKREWPMLTVLDVYKCPMLKVFEIDIQYCLDSHLEGQDCLPEEHQALVSADKVTPHLEVLSLNKEDAMMIEQGQVRVDLQKLKYMTLCCFHDKLDVFPYVFFSKVPLPSIEKLEVSDCNFKDIFPSQRPDIDYTKILSQLKGLEFYYMSMLISIGLEHSWMAPFPQTLQTLKLRSCNRLTNLVPSTVSFSVLTELIVEDCAGLKYLFTSSTGRSLSQLKTMVVKNCESLQEIIFDKAEESSSSHDEGELIFEHLITLSLESLSSLRRFYNGSCALNYPSLVEMLVINCRNMVTFCAGTITADKLSKVKFEERVDAVPLEFDLNSTIMMATTYLVLGDYDELKDIWLGEVPIPDRCFSNLKSLIVKGCHFLSNAVLPSHILPFLRNLERLMVHKCNSVEAVFDKPLHHTKIGPASALHLNLKILNLNELPNLKHVWNEDPQGIISLPFLEEVWVDGCDSLTSLFPAPVAKGMLKTLNVRKCKGLVEIVAKNEERATEGAIEELIIFSNLSSLRLGQLPNLTCFYPGMHKREWPMLTVLDVYKCPMLKVFEIDIQYCLDSHLEGQDCLPEEHQALVSADKVTPHLEVLSLNKEDAMMIEQGQVRVDLQKLKYMTLCCFHDKLDVFPYVFFSKVPLPSIEKLEVSDCNFKDIFPSQRPDIDYTKILSQLKGLEFYYMSMLISIGLEHSWMAPFPQTLQTLKLRSCNRLTNLVPSTVSFSVLTELIVEDCAGLKYLFTSSTGRSLSQLKTMVVKNCESLQEIIFDKAEESSSSHDEGELIFEHLITLSLESLSSLRRFYNGSCALNYPSLVEMLVINCRNMVTFCAGTITADKLSKVKFEERVDAVPLEFDLNSTIMMATEHLVLGDYLELHDMWLGVVPVPDRSFSNLQSLTVEGCEFLSKAILPSHLLLSLRKLEELKVKDCNAIEAIFEVKMGLASPLKLGLKKMILNKLPNLKHVWNEDPQGIISLPFLEEVLVDGCDSIKSLFPASVAKGMLKRLDVASCKGLVEIVAKDKEGAIEELIIFSSLASLTLWRLPNLTCFYPGMHNREWPMLTVLYVYECPMLKVFETDIQHCPDSHPEGQDCLPEEQQALVSADKVNPHLEELSLNKEDAMMIEQGQVHVDLQKLKYLTLQCFHDKMDVFPYVFFSKVPLPSIEKLEVHDCNFKDIFPSQRPDIDYTKILLQLKTLELSFMPMLTSIGLEHSWMAPFPQTLQTLDVWSCKSLTNLVPSTVSFSVLTELIVEDCEGLKYLFTSSTAKSLVALVKVEITNCKSLKKIVEDDPQEEEPSLKNNVEDEQEKDEPKDDEPEEDKMIFVKLQTLSLSSLPILESFYTGSSTLEFPSLVGVWFTQCDNMKMFCHGDVTVPKNLEGEIDGVPWSGVNTTATNLS